MKTAKQLIAEVDAELNAVKAADMGLEAIGAFAQEALNQQTAGDVIKTKDALDNLVSLVTALRVAVPANVTPTSAGPVGQSPKEQLVQQAHDVAIECLGKMQEALKQVQPVLDGIRSACEQATVAANVVKAIPKE